MAKILVTGAAGFIAARTCQMLLDQGADVVGVDNLNDYYDVRIKQHRLDQLRQHEKFIFEQIDIEDYAGLEKVFVAHQPETVLNLAARAGVRYSLENPHVYFTTNTLGTLNLLELMRHHGVKKLVLASTSSLYAGQPVPFSETSPVNTPISPYAASKKAAEVTAYTYHHLFNIDVSVVRYFTVFGPCGRPDMCIFRFIKWIDQQEPIELFGDGSQTRDFTYIDDIARGTIAAIQPLGYEIINLGGGNEPVSIKYIIEQLEELLGKRAVIHQLPFHKADMVQTQADVSKAQRLLGWKSQVSVEEGLRKSVEWYQQNLPWSRTLKLV
jgi:nucleoside-diphosphate-sugar epimerase